MPDIRAACRSAAIAVLALAAFAAALAPLAAPAAAQQPTVGIQGDPEAREARRQELFAALAGASSEAEARELTDAIWRLWFEAPDADSAALMRDVLNLRRTRDLSIALVLLDSLVVKAPGWAEAWNQRATIRFMVGDFEGSLADIDRVLPLEPNHFGALAGQAFILMQLGRQQEAQAVLRRAVAIHPFLAERALLSPAPGDEGEDI